MSIACTHDISCDNVTFLPILFDAIIAAFICNFALQVWNHVSAPARELVCGLLEKDPEKRCAELEHSLNTAFFVLSDDVVQSVDYWY